MSNETTVEKTPIEEIKLFVKQNEKLLIALGSSLTTSLVMGIFMKKITKNVYKKGFYHGGINGFFIAQSWFDETLGTDLVAMYKTWAEANPDKLTTF